MGLAKRVEIIPIERTLSGGTSFFSAHQSHETLVAEVGREARDELYCHRHQTDQLMVLRGALDLVVIENGRLRCIAMREDETCLVRIPPGVPHGAFNRGTLPAMVVNAVLRHGPHDPRDYQARPIPAALTAQWHCLKGAA